MKPSQRQIVCVKVRHTAEDHFPDVRKMVEIGSCVQKTLEDTLLLQAGGPKIGRWEVLR